MSKRRLTATLFGALILFGLAFPVSNLIAPRTFIPVRSQDEKFKAFSNNFQQKCADCHSPGLTQYPFYFSLPIAKDIVHSDIMSAQQVFQITPEQLSGLKPLTAVQLAKMQRVIKDGRMPPTRYVAMHWNASLSANESKEILEWIRREPNGVGLKAIPENNPFHPSDSKVRLGKRLFFEKKLSADNSESCASCHDLSKGGTDQATVSDGIRGQKGPINSPTVFNAAFNFAQFWDGRASTLQEQAAGPINNPLEMGSDWSQVLAKLNNDKSYRDDFGKIYPQGITDKTVTDAIAVYEQTLITPGSRFDRFLNGDDHALYDEEKQGYKLFVSNNCSSCHTGVNLGGLSYETMGIKQDYFAQRGGQLKEADLGRFNVTKNPLDKYKFKVPTLRNVELTSPYFHDGSAQSLDQAVATMSRVQTGKVLSDRDTHLIVSFLKTLTGELDGKALGH